MTIQVPNYPPSNLVPGFFFNVSGSAANAGTPVQTTLILGQKLSAGTYAAGVPVLAYGVSDVNQGTGGPNSMLARMVARYRRSDPLAQIWVLPLADDGAATATVQTLTLTGPATVAGNIALLIAGLPVTCLVSVGDTATVMATNLAADINAVPNMPVTATSAAGVVTLTADNLGLASGDCPIFLGYYGTQGSVLVGGGVTLTVATTTTGATNPSTALTAALANLGTQAFDFIVNPYIDTTSLNDFDTLLSLTTGRWSWNQQIYGGVFTAIAGTVGARQSWVEARNDQFISAIGYYDGPNPAYEWAADYGGACAASLRANPVLPLGGAGDGVNLTVLAPPLAAQDSFSEQQTLLSSGVSTYLVEAGGQVRVQRAVNTYTKNPAGEPDTSFQDVETTYTLMAVLRQILQQLTGQFGRKVLVADGTPITAGASMVTSQTVLQTVIAIYRTLCTNGLCQNPSTFASQAAAQNVGGGQVYLYLPLMIANQLRVVAGNVSFSKP